MFDELCAEHIRLVRIVNEAANESERDRTRLRLEGFRGCAKLVLSEASYGALLMDADMHYLNQGIDRPMCCGVFLDRKEA